MIANFELRLNTCPKAFKQFTVLSVKIDPLMNSRKIVRRAKKFKEKARLQSYLGQ